MFEHMTFDFILQGMLDRVPDDVDKREGSIIYDALAPTAMELAEAYSNMDLLLIRTFADTADGDDLERRVGEHGVQRDKASAAVRKASFTNSQGEPFDVAIGRRFRLGDIVYSVTERIELGTFHLLAETPGEAGNKDFGEMIPVEPIDGLGAAILQDVLIPGEDEESDESLYAKYLDHINEPAFGGNRADYKRTILAIPGVGGVRLKRAPFGGGTVKAIIIGSDYNAPTPELIAKVKEIIDPAVREGDGYGTAPIGHTVTVESAPLAVVDIAMTVVLEGVTLGQVEPNIQAVIDDYLLQLRKEWKQEQTIVLRISHLETRILALEGVIDISGTTFNGLPENIILPDQIPVKGSVSIQ